MNPRNKLTYLLTISSVVTGMGIAQHAGAQIHTAENLLVDIDATGLADGELSSIANNGTLGGFFAATGTLDTVPIVSAPPSNLASVPGITFDGGDYMQLVSEVGGPVIPAPAGLVGVDPTRTIEVWAYNPDVLDEETMVSWGHRGGAPDGSNLSFNYGNNGTWGAVGHWGSPDIGWNDAGGSPAAGQWHHLVYTYDGTTTRVYADGILSNMEVLAPGVINTHTDTAINLATQLEADGVTPTGTLRGSLTLAKVRIHDGVLSDQQVAENYLEERNQFSPPLSTPPIHQYSFNEAATDNAMDATFADSIGSADGVVRGAGAQLTGSRLALPGGPSDSAPYGDLPNGLLSENSANNGGTGEFSIEGWIRITGNRTWSRIFDFGSNESGELTGPGGAGAGLDYFMLSGDVGGDTANHRLEIRNEDPAGGGIVTGDYPSTAFMNDSHFAVTWQESNGEVKVYENGAEVLTIVTDDPMSDINDINIWLGRSNWTGDQNMQGEYDEVRIYNHVLSPTEVAVTSAAGPNVLPVDEPISITSGPSDVMTDVFGDAQFTVSVRGRQPLSVQWFKNDVAVPGATGLQLNLTNVQPEDNDAQIYAVVSDALGSATSGTAVLRLNDDSIAPELLDIRISSLNSVELIFSEPINPDDAADISLYALNEFSSFLQQDLPLTIVSAEPAGNGSRVILTTEASVPCSFISVTVNGVRDSSVTGNEIAPDSTAEFFHFIPGGVTHLYKFNNPPGTADAGTVLTDIVGGADGDIKGVGASFNGDNVVLPGGASASAAYIDLPNGLLSNNSTNRGGNGELTFEGWVTITGNRNWSRILDFGSSGNGEVTGPGGGGDGTDYLMISAQVGTDTGTHRYELRNEDPAGGGIVTADTATPGFNTHLHYAITWNEATGEIKGYENGVPVTALTADEPMSDINDVNVWLGRSNWTADQNAQGEFDEFRVYNRVLSDGDLLTSFTAGLEHNYGDPQFVNLSVASITMQPGESQQAIASIDFQNAVQVNATGTSCLIYESLDPTVVTVSDTGVITAVGPGTTTILASYMGVPVAGVDITVNAVPVNITSEPDDQTIDELGTATFTVGLAGTQPISIQWYKNNDPIPGATMATLTLTAVPASDDGSTYYAIASNDVGGPQTVTTRTATLTVVADTVAPALTGARLMTLDSILVSFSEPVIADAGDFSLTGIDGAIALASLEMSADSSHVILTSVGDLPCGQINVVVSGVTDVSAAANEIAPGTSTLLYHLIPGGVTHHYNFNGVPGSVAGGTMVPNLAGSNPALVLGDGAQFDGDNLRLPGGASASAPYVDLENGLVSQSSANNGGSGQITLEGWVRVTGNRNWSRLFDFGSSTAGELNGPGGAGEGLDYLFLSAQVGTDVALRQIELRNEDPAGGGGGGFAQYGTATFDQDLHYAVTWDESTGQIVTYENGVQVSSLDTTAPMSDLNDINVWLGRSNWTGDQNMQGDYDQFRVYDRALNADEVSASFNAGPESNYGDALGLSVFIADSTMEGGATQPIDASADFESFAGLDMTGSPCLQYESSDTGVVTVDAQGVITAAGGGDAVITVRLGVLSQTLNVSVGSVNTAPVAVDDTYSVDEDTVLTADAAGGVLANDTDAEGDALSAELASGPANGSLILNSDGSFSYTPNANFHGTDSFTYAAHDGTDPSEAATVTITVNAINDPPICSDTSASTDEDAAVAIILPASDVDGDDLVYSIVDQPANGSVTIADNVATYLGSANFCGIDSFTYAVQDPSGAMAGPCIVTVTVNPVNDAPSAVIEIGSTVDLGPSVSGHIVISPDNTGACVLLDGSLSSVPDATGECGDGASAIVSYLWLIDEAPAGTEASVQLCLPVGTHTVTLIVEDGSGAMGEATATIEVLTGCEAVEELIMVVEESVIERQNKRQFLATLKTACAAFDRGSVGSALNRLEHAFQNKVRAQVGRDNPDVAEEWIRIAQEIVDAISNPPECEGCDE